MHLQNINEIGWAISEIIVDERRDTNFFKDNTIIID